VDRVFLDANVLFSAAYMESSGLAHLWQLADAELLSSDYAIEEARRNLALVREPALARLDRLTAMLTIVNLPQNPKQALNVRIDSKDRPILLAAIRGKADYLLTGDGRHFGHLYGKRVEGVMVLRPAQYIERRAERSKS
jgi:predicted nucleic acid-binding protein